MALPTLLIPTTSTPTLLVSTVLPSWARSCFLLRQRGDALNAEKTNGNTSLSEVTFVDSDGDNKIDTAIVIEKTAAKGNLRFFFRDRCWRHLQGC